MAAFRSRFIWLRRPSKLRCLLWPAVHFDLIDPENLAPQRTQARLHFARSSPRRREPPAPLASSAANANGDLEATDPFALKFAFDLADGHPDIAARIRK